MLKSIIQLNEENVKSELKELVLYLFHRTFRFIYTSFISV